MLAAPPCKETARFFAERRRSAGLTIGDVAALARTSRNTVAVLEKYGVRPGAPILRRICQVLDIDLADLPPPPPEPEDEDARR